MLTLKHHFIACLLLFIPISTHAWWDKGHVSISQIAYNLLSPSQQSQIDDLINPIYQNLPKKIQEQLQDTYPDPQLSNYSRLCTMPDVWVDHSAKQFFNNFNATLPANLTPFENEKIYPWHFINIPYPQSMNCPQPSPPNVIWAIDILTQSLSNKIDLKTKAVCLIFLSHLIEDCHQPLHTFTQVNKLCQNDEGGNLFCMIQEQNGHCDLNLHDFLDSSFFFFNNQIPAQMAQSVLNLINPPDSFSPDDLHNLNATSWADQNYQQADLVYSIPQNSSAPPLFSLSIKLLCQSQASLAAYRLHYFIMKYIL